VGDVFYLCKKVEIYNEPLKEARVRQKHAASTTARRLRRAMGLFASKLQLVAVVCFVKSRARKVV
jgi:hypothetical protein